jgi:hypothetical protein
MRKFKEIDEKTIKKYLKKLLVNLTCRLFDFEISL